MFISYFNADKLTFRLKCEPDWHEKSLGAASKPIYITVNSVIESTITIHNIYGQIADKLVPVPAGNGPGLTDWDMGVGVGYCYTSTDIATYGPINGF